MKKNIVAILSLASLVGLLAVELLTHYDTVQRQIALAITNVAGVSIFFAVRAWLKPKGIVLPWTVLTFIAVAAWLDALGNFQHLYARFWWWDRATHVFGLLPVTVGVYLTLERLNLAGRIHLPHWARALFAVSIANLFGAAYEISEWLGDIWFHTERIRGPFDTPHDLLNNLIGSLLVIAGAMALKRLTAREPSASIPA
jgi:hypothetical protein